MFKIQTHITTANSAQEIKKINESIREAEINRSREEHDLVSNLNMEAGVLEIEATRNLLLQYLSDNGIGHLVISLIEALGNF